MNPADMVTELMIPRDAVAPLLKQFSFVRGELSGLLMIPEAVDENAMAAAIAWWQKLAPGEQMIMQSVLAALAAPQLIADISMMSGSSTLLVTRLIMDSKKPGDPVYLLGEDPVKNSFRIERLQFRDLAINTLIIHLAGTDPLLSDAILKFELSRDEMYVLSAVLDLHRQLRYHALMNHLPFPASFGYSDIEKNLKDGFINRDIRWLLPFLLSVIPKKHQPLPTDTIRQSVARLLDLKLMVKGDTADQFSWSEPGRLLADSLSDPVSRVGILLIGVLENGDLAMQSLVLARGDSQVWLVDLNGPNGASSFLSTVTFTDVRSLLEGILRPAGTPRPLNTAVKKEPSRENVTTTPPQIVEKQPVHASDQMVAFCRKCGSPVGPGRKFCGACGATLETAPSHDKTHPLCPRCGSEVNPGMTFCWHCGGQLDTLQGAGQPHQNLCPKCGRANKPGATFCFSCGARLS